MGGLRAVQRSGREVLARQQVPSSTVAKTAQISVYTKGSHADSWRGTSDRVRKVRAASEKRRVELELRPELFSCKKMLEMA